MFKLIKTAAKTRARLGELRTGRGLIKTPFFMPVGTLGAVKAIKQDELLQKVKAQIVLGNAYHLYLRPGCSVIEKAGGLHAFMNWEKPILTDSGGYQVFSLSDNRKLTEEGAHFKSHLDGSNHLFTPENVVEIQRSLGSDVMMMLDECPPYPCSYEYARESMELTHRWATRGREQFLKTEPMYAHSQAQFSIVQGGTFKDLRTQSAQFMSELDMEGIAIGGLSVGEPAGLMYEMTEINTGILPEHKPRYLMGVGTPANLLHSIARGVDMFDCVLPTRNGRNGQLFTRNGIVNIRNAKWKNHHKPLDEDFPTELCQNYKMSYIHHLFRNKELLGLQLASLHNVTFYCRLMEQVRQKIKDNTFDDWYEKEAEKLEERI